MISNLAKAALQAISDLGKRDNNYVPKVKPSFETMNQPQRYQNRNKYLGNGKLRIPKLSPM
jgi:hypothetical protein